MKDIKLRGFEDRRDFDMISVLLSAYNTDKEDYNKSLGPAGCVLYATKSDKREYVVYETRTLTKIVRQR